MADLTLSTVADFIAAAQSTGVTTVVLAWRREWGPAAGGAVHYGPQQDCRLLAYRDGRILACDLPGAERQVLAAELRAAGLQVEERCRNSADFGIR